MRGIEDKKYRWIIAVICFLTVMVGLGFCAMKSIYLKTVSEDLEITRSAFAVTEIIRYLTTAGLNLFFGTLITKLGARKMILIGAVSLLCAPLCSAFAQDVWLLYLGGAFLGAGLAWSTTTMVGYVIGKWFPKTRGTVLGVVLASSGLGAALCTWLLRPVVIGERFFFGTTGWRLSYLLSAALMLPVILLLLAFFRESPKHPEEGAAAKKRRGRQWEGMEWNEVRRKPYFYVAVVCVFFVGLCLQSANGCSVAHLEDVGLESDYITNIASYYALTLCFAKMITGFGYDKLGLRITMLSCLTAGTVAIYLLAMVTPETPGMALAYELLIPFALPMETVMLPLIAADMFGEKCFPKIMGLFVSINTAGYAAGALLSNAVFDLVGSYKLALLVFSGILLIATVAEQLCLIPAARDRKAILERAKNNA
ncbi:MAG: MFS transporter [Oscillospiraceae bacterium]|nr:MFS transporter [Oscillospiraceae bacterium]